MNEMGKIHLQRNLCRYAAQLRLIDQEKWLFVMFAEQEGRLPV